MGAQQSNRKFEGVVKVFAELAFLQPPPVTNVTMRAGRVEGALVQMNVGHMPHQGAPFCKNQVPIVPTCLCTPLHMRPNRLHPGKENLISSLACCSHLAYDTWKRHMFMRLPVQRYGNLRGQEQIRESDIKAGRQAWTALDCENFALIFS